MADGKSIQIEQHIIQISKQSIKKQSELVKNRSQGQQTKTLEIFYFGLSSSLQVQVV